MKDDAYWIRDQVKAHSKWFEESIPTIASENLMSPLAKEMMISDFHDRYAEGMPGKRYYQGNIYVDKVESRCMEIGSRLFKVPFVDTRPTSGTVANMAVLFAFTEPGDTITTAALANGAHISTAQFGAVGLRGVKTVNYPWDESKMTIDVDGARKVLLQTRPKVAQFGLSLFLFPVPLRELSDTFQEIGCTVWYDAAHVLGLIAGGQFQDPLHEGANIVSSSTHKTFPGPNHGLLLGNNLTDDQEKKLRRAVFPGVTSSHHLHAMAALAVTMAEMEEFGKAYAKQIVANSQALGQAMHELGMDVLCPNLGFTKSHTIAVNVSKHGGGDQVAKDLEAANIITNKNMLPGDESSIRPSGIRIGTQEMTRLGMTESEMRQVASLIHRVAVKKEAPAKVKEDVKELKKHFATVQYCYHAGKPAYKYPELV
ncbi:MAG TPA: serine hydroxymethyltransferase [Methanomassiliicoccales archaeon]|nr:serine hydroxymethyltransferase [Methanomassiliicoccales archaeon]